MIKRTVFCFSPLFLASIIFLILHFSVQAMDFVTVSDTEHFPWAKNLIESILKYNYTKVSRIAVFDLGLLPSEINELKEMPFVEVHEIENINPDMRKKFAVRTNERLARGWYSWKPVVLKQAFELFPDFLYLDSGIEVMSPLDDIFYEIKNAGYYLYDCPHLIFPVVTDRLVKLLELDRSENKWILEKNGISAGIIGLSQSMRDSFIMPVYEWASNIYHFEDNGTAPWGYGFARYEQAMLSVLAHKLGLKLHPLYCIPKKIRHGSTKTYFGALKYLKIRKHIEKDPERLKHAKEHRLLG